MVNDLDTLVVCSSFQFVDFFYFCIDKKKIYVKEFFKLWLSYNRKNSNVWLLSEEIFYVVTTTYHKGQMITQAINLSIGYQVGSSQENSTRSLFLINVLFIQSAPGPCYNYLTLPYSPCSILMSTSLLTQGHHVYSMCLDIIFQTLLPCSRLMMSHHVICHVTSLSRAFFIIFPGK